MRASEQAMSVGDSEGSCLLLFGSLIALPFGSLYTSTVIPWEIFPDINAEAHRVRMSRKVCAVLSYYWTLLRGKQCI